jgi:hypothetical protein
MKPEQECTRADLDDAAARRTEPPALYFPACGAFCDAFWWARRRDSGTREEDANRAVRDRADRM